MIALRRQNKKPQQTLEWWRRGRTNHHVSWFVKVRQNVSKRLKARQICVDDDDKCNLEKASTLINCTGHPMMHRIPNTNYLICRKVYSSSSVEISNKSLQLTLSPTFSGVWFDVHHYILSRRWTILLDCSLSAERDQYPQLWHGNCDLCILAFRLPKSSLVKTSHDP